MRNIILNATIAFAVSASLVGCAGGPSVKKDAANPLDTQIKPSYSEKVGAQRPEELKSPATCPHDASFEKEDWHRQVAYANACVKAKDWARTDKLGSSLAVHAPLTPWGPYYMALAAGSRKDYPRAQWMLELATKKAPSEGIFHYELARLNWEIGEDAGAIKEMKLASDLNPALSEAHLVMGQLALRKGDLGEARRYLRKTLANDPNHAQALLASADVEMKAKDWNKAEEILSKIIAVYPRLTKVRLMLAQLQEQQLKKTNEALANYKAIKQLASERKLDEGVGINLDEKILALEKSLSQVNKGGQVTDRKPSTERIAQ